jgi:hypothetical protein
MAADESTELARARQFGFARVSLPPDAPAANQDDTDHSNRDVCGPGQNTPGLKPVSQDSFMI